MSRLFVIGLGPGSFDEISPRAIAALTEADILAGYGPYIKLIKDHFPNKEYLVNGMTGEVKRCQMAIEAALSGKKVAMVSSGDSGVYGMAGLILQLAGQMAPDLPVEIIPGITASTSGAALLGAPLMHDFAVISLSDRLTPWDLIEKRLALAAEGDFVINLYNPRSKGRPNNIVKAREIFLQYKSPQTPVGIVENIGREGQRVLISDLEKMPIEEINMFSTVIVGNSRTYVENGRMITPRGYLEVKEDND